jgi:serine/threonine protein kinase/CheY-like chemotaxis protein
MKKRILLVEYATSTVEIIKELFSNPIFDITIVNEGDTAKQKLNSATYDLLITAAMLPKFHGFNLSQHTAETYPGTRIIIISEIYKGMDYKHQATTQYKADDFFEKPFDKKEFKARVLELLKLAEEDLVTKEDALTTTEIPIHDTKKVPTLNNLEEESKKMTSEDLFGDIIEAVQEGDSSYEIKLNDDAAKDVPPFTQVINKSQVQKTKKKEKKAAIKIPKSAEKKLDELDAMTKMLKVDDVVPEIGSHETKPEEIFVLTDMAPETMELPAVTREMKKAAPPTTPSPVTQKIDLDLLNLVRENKKPQEKDKKKFQKIEQDISKKFEETLSGLGLGAVAKPATKPVMNPVSPPQAPDPEQKKTEIIATMEKPADKIEDKNDDVGGYDILGLIARGGMAEIYKAKRKGVKGFEKLIALKKILSGYGADDKYIEMFVDEAKIAAQLTHPNIVQIYDLGKKDDYYFIAMEYVSGKDLRYILNQVIKNNSFIPEALAIFLTIKILEALNYAHSARDGSGTPLDIVHRDISPPNILVSFNGDIKLTDFGVSKASIKLHHTVAGALKGKLLYMSPEQSRGDGDVDYRSDLFSVGIILFELITGRKLFLGTSEMGTLKKVQDCRITKPSQYKRDLAPELEEIILKSLSKEPDQRYQKASDMIKALDTFMIKNYDNMPDTSHISHFVYTLFKDEIVKNKIEINLKPIPYSIKKRPIEITFPDSDPESTPDVKPASIPVPPPVLEPDTDTFPETKIELDMPPEPAPPSPVEFKTLELERPQSPQFQPEPLEIDEVPVKVEPQSPMAASQEEAEILELTSDQQIPEDPPQEKQKVSAQSQHEDSSKAKDDESFQPVIEINFDEDQENEPPKQESHDRQQLEPIDAQIEAAAVSPSLATQFGDSAEEKGSGKKKNLLIVALIIIVVLVATIVYFLVINTSSEPVQPESRDDSAQVSGVQATGQESTLPLPQQGDPLPAGTEGETQTADTSGGEDELNTDGSSDTASQEQETSTPKQTIPALQQSETSKTDPLKSEKQEQKKSSGQKKTNNKEIDNPAVVPTRSQPESTQFEESKVLDPEKKKKKKRKKEESQQQAKPQESQAESSATTEKVKEESGAKAFIPVGNTGEAKAQQAVPASQLELKPQPQPLDKPKPELEKPQEEAVTVKEGDILSPNEVDTKVTPISTPEIKISRSIRRLMMSNQRVLVSYLIDHKGNVEIVKMIKKSRMKKLNELIIESIKKWKFKPATKNNVKVKVWKNGWITINK